MTIEQIEVTTGTQIKLGEQLSPCDDVLGGEKCAVKRWRVEVKEVSAADALKAQKALEAKQKADDEVAAKIKKEEAEKAAKIAAEAAKHQPPPP